MPNTASRNQQRLGFRLRLLGGLHVSVDGRQYPARAIRRKVVRLISLLALAPDHCLHRDELIAHLWPDSTPDAGLNALHRLLHAARRVLEPEITSGRRTTYLRWSEESLVLGPTGSVWTDVAGFQAAAQRAQHARTVDVYRAAVALYTGDLLPDELHDGWLIGRREQLRGLHRRIVLDMARLLVAEERYSWAIEVLEGLVAGEPTDEPAQRELIRARALAGYPRLAVQQYEHLAEVLDIIDAQLREIGDYTLGSVARTMRSVPAAAVSTSKCSPAAHRLTRSVAPNVAVNCSSGPGSVALRVISLARAVLLPDAHALAFASTKRTRRDLAED